MIRDGINKRLTCGLAGWPVLLTVALVFATLNGCAKKTKTEQKTDEKTAKTPGDKVAVKKPEKKKAKKPPVKKKKEEPVVKKEPKKKEAVALVPIDQVKTQKQALAYIKAHVKPLDPDDDESEKPDIGMNSLGDVRKINFIGTNVSDKHLALLKYFTSLAELNLSGTKISDAGMTHLKGLDRLSELYLYDTAISDTGIKNLSDLTRLEKLCLDKTRISDKGMAHLKNLVELTHLHIRSRNKITDAGLAHVVGLTLLREFWIHGNGFTKEGVKALKEKLPRCEVDWKPTPVAGVKKSTKPKTKE